MPARLLRVLVALVLSLCGLTVSLATSAPAVAAGTGSISGTVTADGAGYMSQINVWVYDEDAEVWDYYGSTAYYPDPVTGDWEVTGLDDGRYRVWFGGGQGYAPEWFNNSVTMAGAEEIVISGGSAFTTADADLEDSAVFQGTVTAAGEAVSSNEDGAYLWVHSYTEEQGWTGGSYFIAADGTYRADLPAGEYRVEVRDSNGVYAPQFHDGGLTAADGPTTEISNGETETVDFELEPGATISGRVTDTAGDPIEGACVSAQIPDPAPVNPGQLFKYYAGSCADADGNYSISALPAATFTLNVNANGFVSEWLENDYSWSGIDAEDVTVTSGEDRTEDLVLLEHSSISGTVTDEETTNPLAGVTVTAERQVGVDWEYAGSGYTTGGTYLIENLAPGDYRLRFERSGYVTEWYDDVLLKADALAVPVGDEEDVDGIDAELAAPVVPQEGIAGVVTADDTSMPLEDVYVFAYTGDLTTGDIVSDDYTDAEGEFVLEGLTEGEDYRLFFDGTQLDYGFEFWEDAQLQVDADPVTYDGDLQGGYDVGLAPDTTPDPVILNVTPPSVSGTAKVGTRLSANPGAWNPAPDGYTYQWLKNGVPIPGAIAPSYVVGAGQVGTGISVRVGALKSGYPVAYATSPRTGAVAPGTIAVTTKPKLTGKAKVGKQLTLKPGAYNPAAKLTFSWFVDGKKVKGAKGKTFKLKAGMVGKKITAEVKATLAGYTTLTVETKGKTAKA